MKLQILYLIPLIISTSCSQLDEIQNTDNQFSLLNDDNQKQYETTQLSIGKRLGEIISSISNTNSRNDNFSGEDFILYITNLPSEVIDSLYEVHCTPDKLKELNSHKKAFNEALIHITSEESVDFLYDFMDNYIEIGGNSTIYLANALNNAPYDIQNYLIISAACIDEFSGPLNNSRGANSYCLRQLSYEASGMLLASIAGDGINAALSLIPGGAMVGTLVSLGVDVCDAIKMVNDYNKCCIRHWS